PRPQLGLAPPILAGVFATGAAHPCVAACAPVLAHQRVRSGPVLAAPASALAPARIRTARPAGPAPASGGDILEAEAKGFEYVLLLDFSRAVEVGGRARDAPGAMEASRRKAALGGPALERAPRGGSETGELAKSRRFELGVEAALAVQLA